MRLLESLREALMRSSRTFVWSATASGLIVLLSFFVAIGYDLYRGTLLSNEQAAKNIASLVEQDIARNLELYNLSLQGVLDGIGDAHIMGQEPALRRKILFGMAATAKGLGALVALDQDGSIFLDSLSTVPRKGNFADREYFIIHRDAPHDIGLYVSRPFRARLQGDIWSISVSRRITLPDGGFGGIVSGTIRLDYFQRLFRKVTLGEGASLSLFRDDGILILRNVEDDDAIGRDWSAAPVFAHLPGRTSGSFTSDRSIDGVARLYAFHRIGALPLVAVVGLSKDHVLAPWRSKIFILTAIFSVMAGSVILLVWLLEGELRRRANAESAAAEMARTDALTKLANRRWFDEGLAHEWARAVRGGEQISLVMIDIDAFKLFNDSYGHQAGDNALAAVGGVIGASVRRSGDLAARYGGEEFAVLLPNTDRAGAMRVATAIRDRVAALRQEHGASGHGILTVSAGVATALPVSGVAAATLVRDADAALYRAKEQGGNTVCVSNVVQTSFEPLRERAV